MKVVASAMSDRDLERNWIEDRYLIEQTLGLYVVCDGMSGYPAGEVAIERAIKSSSEHISASADFLTIANDRPEGYFRVPKVADEAVQAASQRVYGLSKASAESASMGMTMSMIVDHNAIMVHAGDSRMSVKCWGEMHELTVDHTLANEMFLSGGLTKEAVAASRYQHVLTRSIDPHEFVINTLLYDVVPRDRMLPCLDGLRNPSSDASIIAHLLAKPGIVTQAVSLIEYAKDSGGVDNITADEVEALRDADAVDVPNTNERIGALRQSFLGRKLSLGRLLHLLSTSSMMHCNTGKELITTGDYCPGVLIVIEGSFRATENDLVDAKLTSGVCFGVSTLNAPEKSPATLIANEPSTVLCLDHKKFNQLARPTPRMGNSLLRNRSRHLSEIVVACAASIPSNLDETGPFV